MHIVQEGHPALARVCAPWDFALNGSPKLLATRMINAAEKDGIGLAANQVDRPERMFVIKVAGGWLTCVNPEILKASMETAMEAEGCLSFPGLFLKVRRPVSILATWWDQDGERREPAELTGIHARCFQHELDHLNGKTFVDGRSVAVAMARKKIAKRGRR